MRPGRVDMERKKTLIPWPEKPEQINQDMLDDIAGRVSAAMPVDKKRDKAHILDMINKIIADHYGSDT